MYESPVNLIFQDIERQIVQKQEQTILNAISKCDVVVDKEELIKAINYDRNQYSKGYKDGVSDVLDKIIAEIDDEADYAYADFDRYKEDILHAEPDELPDDDFRYGLRRAIEIINKYKRKSEE